VEEQINDKDSDSWVGKRTMTSD